MPRAAAELVGHSPRPSEHSLATLYLDTERSAVSRTDRRSTRRQHVVEQHGPRHDVGREHHTPQIEAALEQGAVPIEGRSRSSSPRSRERLEARVEGSGASRPTARYARLPTRELTMAASGFALSRRPIGRCGIAWGDAASSACSWPSGARLTRARGMRRRFPDAPGSIATTRGAAHVVTAHGALVRRGERALNVVLDMGQVRRSTAASTRSLGRLPRARRFATARSDPARRSRHVARGGVQALGQTPLRSWCRAIGGRRRAQARGLSGQWGEGTKSASSRVEARCAREGHAAALRRRRGLRVRSGAAGRASARGRPGARAGHRCRRSLPHAAEEDLEHLRRARRGDRLQQLTGKVAATIFARGARSSRPRARGLTPARLLRVSERSSRRRTSPREASRHARSRHRAEAGRGFPRSPTSIAWRTRPSSRRPHQGAGIGLDVEMSYLPARSPDVLLDDYGSARLRARVRENATFGAEGSRARRECGNRTARWRVVTLARGRAGRQVSE